MKLRCPECKNVFTATVNRGSVVPCPKCKKEYKIPGGENIQYVKPIYRSEDGQTSPHGCPSCKPPNLSVPANPRVPIKSRLIPPTPDQRQRQTLSESLRKGPDHRPILPQVPHPQVPKTPQAPLKSSKRPGQQPRQDPDYMI